MSRMWLVWSPVLVLALLVSACGPKEQPTTADDKMDVETETVEPAEEVAPPPAPPSDDDVRETPWYENKSLVELNEEAIRRGFHPNVHFETDKSDLQDEARQKLADNARFLSENPSLRATIEGHCDERGTNEYNLALGDRRANNSRDYISSLGVTGSRMRTISYGEERPVCTETDESCWWRNRRAYFVLSVS